MRARERRRMRINKHGNEKSKGALIKTRANPSLDGGKEKRGLTTSHKEIEETEVPGAMWTTQMARMNV